MPKKGSTDRVFLQNSIKTLATNIRFASVDDPVTSLVVTSSVPNEGKSTIAVELACAMAGGGQRVLLVECDMRRRTIANMLGLHARSGLYAVLSGQAELADAVVETGTRGLQFLDCEPHIPNPVDVLSSKRFHRFAHDLRGTYGFVIFDTPPLSAFVDAAVLSSVADATLLVVRQNFVRRDELAAAYAQLQKAEANVIGAVMNYCESEKSDYYYSYYAKGEKGGASRRERDESPVIASAPAAPAQKVPAPQAAPAARRTAAPAARGASAQAGPAVPGLRPLPNAPAASPGSTAQFLAGTSYRPRVPVDDE
ncbi:CpsD/CapB family tyrosine-protein kinase [Thermophilibacter sp.]